MTDLCHYTNSTGLVCGKPEAEHFPCDLCDCVGFNYDVGEHPGVCNCSHLDSQHRLAFHVFQPRGWAPPPDELSAARERRDQEGLPVVATSVDDAGLLTMAFELEGPRGPRKK